MKINIYPIVSSLHEKGRINEETQRLLNQLMNSSKHEFNIVDLPDLYKTDLGLILVQSGGSEQLFLQNYQDFKEPYYLLTYGNNNSLAASLEILSYLKDNNLEGEVLHGSIQYLNKRINELLVDSYKDLKYRFGVIGKPSDWLISSKVNYNEAKRVHNIDLIDININEVIELYNNCELIFETEKYQYNKVEVNKALKLDYCINQLKEKYKLDGLTIRCFDLLDKIHTTSCLSLALLNDKGIIGTCEGDIPAMISMHVINKVCQNASFQANPSHIDIESKTMVLAHCTLPLTMTKSYSLDTHFESGIGIGIKGELKEEKITIFKLSRNLKDYFVTTGKIIRNLNYDNLCRTQIEIKVEDIDYFLKRPYGNHHIVVYGDCKEKIIQYMNKVLKENNNE